MKWFKLYIWGTQFVLRTDQASLQWSFRQINDKIIFRMIQRLQEFDFQVVQYIDQETSTEMQMDCQDSAASDQS